MLTSYLDPAGRRVLQHDMEDDDRLLTPCQLAAALEDYEVYYEVHYTSYTHIQRMGSNAHTRIA